MLGTQVLGYYASLNEKIAADLFYIIYLFYNLVLYIYFILYYIFILYIYFITLYKIERTK